MRGQRLFVRPIEPSDGPAIEHFLRQNQRDRPAPACGLLGKVVGDLVAVVVLEVADDSLRIADVVVAPELRRKRIGRFMLDEASRLALKMDRSVLVVDDPGDARAFFARAGFDGATGPMVRRVE